jgi:hypothetical protein
MATSATPKMHCTLTQEGPVTVSWKAYKTPAKLAVGGVFDTFRYTPPRKEGTNFKEILLDAVVTIDEKSVNSKNKGRDAKLVKFFFDQMQGDTIRAKIIDIVATNKKRGAPKTGTILTEITMNGITKKVPMHYSCDQGTLTASGVIDLFDFSASPALKSLNKACFAKHQGKTWNDVNIGFTTHIKAVCEPVKK